MMALLLQAGTHIGAQDAEGLTSPHRSTRRGEEDEVVFLLQQRTDPNQTDGKAGQPYILRPPVDPRVSSASFCPLELIPASPMEMGTQP